VANGCDLIQGFLFHPPMDGTAFANLLQRQDAVSQPEAAAVTFR